MGKLLIQGKLYSPIKVGDPGDWYENEPNGVCGDCGERYGEQHMPQCDVERCPACGGQMLSCDCGPVFDVDENTSEQELNELIELQKAEIIQRKYINGFMELVREQLKESRPDIDFYEIAKRFYTAENKEQQIKFVDELYELLNIPKPQSEM